MMGNDRGGKKMNVFKVEQDPDFLKILFRFLVLGDKNYLLGERFEKEKS